VSREAGVIASHSYPMQYLGRLSDGRTPTFWQTDLSAQQDIGIARGTRFSVGIIVTNLFDQDAVTSKYSTETELVPLDFKEADLYAGRLDFAQLFTQQHTPRDPRFLMDNAYQAPRTARVFVKWIF
jgi:outer membrane receptor protein involved in Fe transport